MRIIRTGLHTGSSQPRQQKAQQEPETDENGFMNITEGIEEEMPFS